MNTLFIEQVLYVQYRMRNEQRLYNKSLTINQN